MNELYSYEHEKFVIGLLANHSITDASEARDMVERAGLEASDFHHPLYRAVFAVGKATIEDGMPMDPLSIIDALKSNADAEEGFSRSGVIEVLTQPIVSEHVFEPYAKKIKDLALRRGIVKTLAAAAEEVSNPDVKPGELVLKVCAEMTRAASRSRAKNLNDILGGMIDEIDRVQSGSVEPIIPSGIAKYDKFVGGLQPTLNVFGALPGVGKSAFVATVVNSLAARGIPVGLFSLEDEGSWLGWRLLANESGVDQFILRFRKHDSGVHAKLGDGYMRLHKYGANVIVDDRHGLSPADIALSARDMVLNHGCRVIIIDHLGEVRVRQGSNDTGGYAIEVAEGLSDLRAIAKRHYTPVLVCCHLTRASEGDTPKLSHFANSAAIERQARVAIAATREQGSDTMTLHVLKNTNGKAGINFDVEFVGSAAMIKAVENGYERRPAAAVPDSQVPGADDGDH